MATQFIRTMRDTPFETEFYWDLDATAWTTRESAAGKRQVKTVLRKADGTKWHKAKGTLGKRSVPLMILQRFFHGHGGGAFARFRQSPAFGAASEAALSGAICTAQTAKPRAFMAAKSSGSADEATPRLRIAPETAMP